MFEVEASVCPAAYAACERRAETVSGSTRAVTITNVMSIRIRFGLLRTLMSISPNWTMETNIQDARERGTAELTNNTKRRARGPEKEASLLGMETNITNVYYNTQKCFFRVEMVWKW